MPSTTTSTGAEQLTNEAGEVYVRTLDDALWTGKSCDVASLSAHRLGFHAKAFAEDGRNSARYGAVTVYDVVGIKRREPLYDGGPIELFIETKAGTVRLFLFEAAEQPVEPEGED